MDPATAIGLYKTFMETYKFVSGESEDEKIEQAVVDSLKEFKFFYEDAEWDKVRGADRYQRRMRAVSDDVRKIAVKADNSLSDDVVQEIRDLAAELEAFANKNLLTGIGIHTGELIKEELEDSYNICSEIVEELET